MAMLDDHDVHQQQAEDVAALPAGGRAPAARARARAATNPRQPRWPTTVPSLGRVSVDSPVGIAVTMSHPPVSAS